MNEPITCRFIFVMSFFFGGGLSLLWFGCPHVLICACTERAFISNSWLCDSWIIFFTFCEMGYALWYVLCRLKSWCLMVWRQLNTNKFEQCTNLNGLLSKVFADIVAKPYKVRVRSIHGRYLGMENCPWGKTLVGFENEGKCTRMIMVWGLGFITIDDSFSFETHVY